MHAARAGNLTIANAVGNGVADDKLIYTYVPDLIEYYLGEPPLLRNVDTYRLRGPDVRAFVLDRLDQMVVKPVDASGGYGLVFGPACLRRGAGATAGQNIVGDPRGYIAQPVVTLSTGPTLVDGRLRPRHLDLRPVRGQRRREGVGAARRPHPGGPARGQPGRELQPGRRLQGHVGAAPTPTTALGAATTAAPVRPPAARPSAPVPLQFGPADDHERHHQQQLQQQQQTERRSRAR